MMMMMLLLLLLLMLLMIMMMMKAMVVVVGDGAAQQGDGNPADHHKQNNTGADCKQHAPLDTRKGKHGIRPSKQWKSLEYRRQKAYAMAAVNRSGK
jgi:hypothetical protein